MDSQHNDGQGPGRLMSIMAWVGALLLLSWLFNGLLEARFNPNGAAGVGWQGEGSPEVQLEANARGHYVVDGWINGRPVTFLVDTGATDVALSERLALSLALPKMTGVLSETANGVVAGWRSELRSLRVGGIVLEDVAATVLPNMGEGEVVLLGMSALKRLELVQRDRQLILRVPSAQ